MPLPYTVQLLVNPTAGSLTRKRIDALASAFSAAGARVVVTDSRAEISPEADHVCVVGGDGTLRNASAAMRRAARAVTMSVFPMGTVNLIARECAYPKDARAFVAHVLRKQPPRLHHVALIGNIIVSGVASVGPDSYAVAGVSSLLKRAIGRAAYVAAFMRLLVRWRRPQLRVTSGKRNVACEAVYIAKGRFFAGPWSFAPEAALDRPLLQVVALIRATRRDYFRFVWALARGRFDAHPNLIRFACAEVTIEGDSNIPFQADGDIVARLPVDIRLCADALAFA